MSAWAEVRPGDLDPEGSIQTRHMETCGQPSPPPLRRSWCTRTRHEDPTHAAAGARGYILAVWGGGYIGEVEA